MSGEPLDQLREQLDPGACRLANLPSKIWLFGGKGGFRMGSSDPSESLRESFWRQTLSLPPSPARRWINDLDIPENHHGWWAFSGYADLLMFERDACHLARAVILFPESPGSLAELGALAVDESIVDRLLVFVQAKYLHVDNRESFLNLGPLRRVESRKNRCVIGAESPTDLSVDDFETITDFIDARLPHVPGTEKLRIENPTHKLLLIADLIDLLLISKPAELQIALHHFGVSISSKELDQATKLLEFFQLIRVEHRGTEYFFVRRDHADRAWVDYTSKEGQPVFDRSRFKLARRELLQGDRRKLSVLERGV